MLLNNDGNSKLAAFFLHKKSNSTDNWLPLAGILCLALFLYLYQIGSESLWTDEFFSILDAEAFPEKLHSTRPVYYILLRGWMLFGDSDTWLRLLSVPFALGSVLITYMLGKKVLDNFIGLVSALLLTLSPLFINHTQEVRMYTLSTFLGLAGTFVMVRVLELPSFKGTLAWLSLRILAVLTTPLNILLFLPDSLLLTYRYRNSRRFLLTVAGGLIVLAAIMTPWTVSFVNSSLDFFNDWVSDAPKPTLVNVVSRLTNFTAYWPLQGLESSLSQKFYKLYTLILCLLVVCGFLAKRYRGGYLLVAAYGFLPASILFAVSWLMAPVWLPRYLLFVTPYLLILIAAGFAAIKNWQPKIAIAIAIVYLVAVGGGLHAYYSKQYRDDWRGVSELISEKDQPGDMITLYTSIARPQLLLSRYYDGNAPILLKDLKEADSHQLPTFESRLWIVYKPQDTDSLENTEFGQTLIADYEVTLTKTFRNESGWEEMIEVFLLEK
jgi:mannosyltransferase